MSKKEILSELKQIVDDANGYDIDPYILEQLIEKTKMSKREYVYVTLDPLLEEVVCVHKKENSTCDKCERLIRERKNSYQLEVSKFLVKD